MSGIFRYFKRLKENELTPKSRELAYKEVKKCEERTAAGGMKRGRYEFCSPTNKAKVAKYASENGVTASLRHFKQTNEFNNLKESTVRGWVKQYRNELPRAAGELSSETPTGAGIVEKLCEKKRGRPLLIGEDLESQVQEFIREVRASGGVINTAITLAAAKGIVLARDANMLSESGGYLSLTSNWAKRLMSRMGLVKRKATTTVKITPNMFEDLKKQFLDDIETVSKFEGIPKDLVINWDQTAVRYVPVSNWTQEVKGAKRVEIVGTDDKRQITATLTVTASGEMLPAQMIYGGKTPACLPKVDFPKGWHITFTPNHWANKDTMVAYLYNVLLPYVTATRQNLQLADTFPALVLFDHFKGQLTERVLDILDFHNILVIDVPAHCTDRLQPLDVSVNKSIKHHLKQSFKAWYANEVHKQQGKPVDLKLTALKPLGAQWFIHAFQYVRGNILIIKNGFVEAGITDRLN